MNSTCQFTDMDIFILKCTVFSAEASLLLCIMCRNLNKQIKDKGYKFEMCLSTDFSLLGRDLCDFWEQSCL